MQLLLCIRISFLLYPKSSSQAGGDISAWSVSNVPLGNVQLVFKG
jgi:hypothetical protein